MHSSRVRTGRTLTVFRCLVPGGGCIPKKAEIKKKFPLNPPPNWSPPSKNWRPLEKLETPKKLETPENLETPEKLQTPQKIADPPKFGTPRKIADPPTENLETPRDWTTPPLWTEFLTHVCENITLAKPSFRPVIKTVQFQKKMWKNLKPIRTDILHLHCLNQRWTRWWKRRMIRKLWLLLPRIIPWPWRSTTL